MVGTIATLVALAITPAAGAPIATAPIPVNTSAGHQIDPHVDGDVAAYTDWGPNQIRYFSFTAAPADADQGIPIPADGTRDQLSDISGGFIVFTRSFPDGHEAVMLFNTATGAAPDEINPGTGTQRSAVAIGNTTLAYVDLLLGPDFKGEVVVWDRAGNSATQITSDTNVDHSPAVSPDGNVVVWVACNPLAGTCEVKAATKAGGWSAPATIAAGVGQSAAPDTNGTSVVYSAGPSGSEDIFIQPLSGGAPVQLELAGAQVNPSIAGDVVGFESLAVGSSRADLFIYHLATGALHQLTNTPSFDESLNDVTVLADESVRVVWQENSGTASGDWDIYAATFALAGSTNTTDAGVVDPPDAGRGDTHCHGSHGKGHRSHGNGHGYGHSKEHRCRGGHHGDDGHGDDDDDDDDGHGGHHGDDDGHGDDGDDDDDRRGGHHGEDDGHGGHHGEDDDHGNDHRSGGHGKGHGHHGRGTGSVHQSLTPDEPAPALGCSSTGTATVPLALLLMSLALFLRPRTNRAEARGRQR